LNTASHEAHREFLNSYYRNVRYVYDATRKYYLFGRDRALRELLAEPWDTLVEVGTGTGRNLIKLHGARPSARCGGVDASDEMLATARKRCPGIRIEHGFAEDADYISLLGERPERILFSYCLSMVQDAERALLNARRQLAPGGKVVIVDFGDMRGLPVFAALMRRFLSAFHVAILDAEVLARHGAELRWGPGRYYIMGVMGPTG
jgi:S-adenosylmethionine-diacylgycerolhomoserine-N-methlytransferase